MAKFFLQNAVNSMFYMQLPVISTFVGMGKCYSSLFLKCFISKDVSTLIRAFIVYVRPIIEYSSSLWSPQFKSDIESIESVQRKFTKRLPDFSQYSY